MTCLDETGPGIVRLELHCAPTEPILGSSFI